MNGLTPTQTDILKYLRERGDGDGVCPSREELRRHFGYSSPNAVTSRLQALRKKKLVSWQPNRARTIRVKHPPEGRFRTTAAAGQIPILGQMAAGTPILAENNVEETLSVPEGYLGSGTHFAVMVRGKSMRDAGIDDGDIALLRKEEVPVRGTIMAVVIEDEAVL